MSREPSAASLVAEGVSRIADAVGVVLLCWLGWRMFFVFDAALQGRALLVGVIGTLACWTDRSAHKNAPLAMLVYVTVGLLSAAIHRWSAVASPPESTWLSLFAPADHLAVMALFIYGAAYLLRTSSRLSWLVVLVVGSVGVLAAQVAFDRASSAFVYVRGGTVSLPSVPQWGGIHGTSLLLTLALPLALSVSAAGGSWWRLLAGTVLGSGLFLVAYFNGSKGGLIAMAVSGTATAVVAALTRSGGRRRRLAAAGVLLIIAMGLTLAMLDRASIESVQTLGFRTQIWRDSVKLSMENPWLGVGPGNFYAPIAGQSNAHNLILHVGAEIGLFGALSLLVFMGWALRSCWRAWVRRCIPTISLGLLFALTGFLVHSISEDFLNARAEVERTRALVWMILAAVLALQRLSSTGPGGRV